MIERLIYLTLPSKDDVSVVLIDTETDDNESVLSELENIDLNYCKFPKDTIT